MQWNRTEINYPEPNRQLLLYLKEAHCYPDYTGLKPTHIIMGVFYKNDDFKKKDGFCRNEEYFFEGLCMRIHLPIDQVLAWLYIPVKESNCTKKSYD